MAFAVVVCPLLVAEADVLESARLRATRAGTSYGGWVFDSQLLDAQSVVYSIGLGTDISWDLSVIKTARCDVHGFDDTPVSTGYLKARRRAGDLPPKFHWHRYLLGDHDGPLTLLLPTGHGISYAASGVGSARGFRKGSNHTARGLTVRSMMRMLNHSRVDVLKMDVEGFEFRVFNSLLLEQRGAIAAVHRLPVCQV